MVRDYSLCMRCGEPGAHYVPPGGGTTGFFYCDPNDKPESTWGPGPNQRRYLGPEIKENSAFQDSQDLQCATSGEQQLNDNE